MSSRPRCSTIRARLSDMAYPQKTVMIDTQLFLDILQYFSQNDVDTPQFQSIKKRINDKADALTRHYRYSVELDKQRRNGVDKH